MKSTTIVAGSLVAFLQILVGVEAKDPLQRPPTFPVLGSVTPQGCFSSKGSLTEYQISGLSSGSCNNRCKKEKALVFALSPDLCLCGFEYPPQDTKVEDEVCNFPCPGYGDEACGALGDAGWSVWNTGVKANVGYSKSDDNPSSSDSPPGATSGAGDPASSSTSTSTSQPDSGNKGGSSIGGIVAGVVVGVVVVAGVCGGLWFFMRRRRNSEIEEEHRRNAAVNAFISGSKPPGSSGSISMTDHRLDPVMNHRRMSNGSIADNEDYSRKILRVTNA